MGRRPARFRQSDVARALRAAKQAGVNMAVEISTDGVIRIVPVSGSTSVLVAPERELVL